MHAEGRSDPEVSQNARARTLLTRIRELEFSNDAYVQRIRQLEGQIGARGIIVAGVPDTSARSPDDPGGDSSHPHERASARRIAELEKMLADGRRSEREKEIVIARLASIADERLHQIDELRDAVEEVRAALECATTDLLAKDAVIAELHAASEERLRQLVLGAGEAEMLRAELLRVGEDRDAKDEALKTLRATLAERLELQVRTTADLQEKDRVIQGLAEASAERLQLIVRLTGEIEMLREACTRLTAQLQET